MGKRYQTQFTINQSPEVVQTVVNDFFFREGFVYVNYKGEMVWKKGDGFLTAPQFMKVDYQNGTVFVQAWLKYTLLPGVFFGEMGLDGFFGVIPKQALKARVNTLMGVLSQQAPQTDYAVQQPAM